MCMRNVLAVLEHDDQRLWSTFDAAVQLAEREHARLTVVTGADKPHVYAWCAGFAAGAVYLPLDSDPDEIARRLARAAEFVRSRSRSRPWSYPVTPSATCVA